MPELILEPGRTEASQPQALCSIRHKRRRRLSWLLAACCLLLACYCFRAPLLTGFANAWIVNEPLEKAGAIVVLGGGLDTRPFAAARLYHQGYAERILIAWPKSSATDDIGLTTREKDIVRQVLIKEGVPESALTEVGESVTSTYEEACAVREWTAANKVNALIIPTDEFHTRRVRWLFRKQLKQFGVKVIVQAVPVREYTVRDWWQNERGIVAFQNEVLKYAYYRFKY